MNQLKRLALLGMISGAIAACSSTFGDSGSSTTGAHGSGGKPDGGTTGGGPTTGGGSTTGGNGTTGGATTGSGGSTGGASGAGGATGGAGGATGGAAGTSGTGGASGSGGSGGGFTTPASAFAAARKIKGVLTGLGPTDAEVAAVKGPTGLRGAIDAWMATPQFQEKMILFFQNTFQQSSLAVLDFEFQLRKRPGAFDLSYAIFGDDAFPMLFKNLKESFGRTALALVAEGRPFTDVLTTQRFMMTTALKSAYMQVEMPYDIHTMSFQFNHGSRPAIEDTLNPNSPNYMIFGYQAPTTSTGRVFTGTCAADATKVSAYPGNTYLFHILLGSVPRDSTNNGAGTTNLGCMEHAMKPYFTAQDLSDWQMVTITNTGSPIRSFDLPALRAATTLPSKLPRVSFFSTPAFLAVWNTNDSNQHRVTANQALLAALGQGYTNSQSAIPTPPSSIGLDGSHAVSGTECYACHKSLDPMRQFWANSFDFNDQVNTKSTSMAASFGFGDVLQNGTSLVDFGKFVGMVTDSQVPGQSVNRFALSMTQKLCFFANSAKCEETDPEMRRVALVFQNANYDFKTLVRELMSSPLVTSFESTATFSTNGVTISVTRRDQLCGALSNRLGKADLCEIVMPTPTDVTTPLNRLAGALPADAFSRGSELPVTSTDPNLFYRAASELVCEAVAAKVVDGPATTTVFASSDAQNAIADMVVRVMGVPPSDGHNAGAVQALRDHYAAAIAAKATPTNALRSTFSAACQSPTSLALGI